MNIHEFNSVSFFSFAGSKKSAVLILYDYQLYIAIVLCKNVMIMKMHEWASKPQVYRLFFASIYKSSKY